MKRNATLIFAGDSCPIGSNENAFATGDVDGLLGDLREEFSAAALRVVNLECPLILRATPSKKIGPRLGAPVGTAAGFKAIGFDVAILANNHIMDHGEVGLASTISALQASGIQPVGAGMNLDEAQAIFVRDLNGIRVGILAVAEHEFGIAEQDRPGANPLDIIDCVRNINKNRSQFDALVIVVHGGSEHYQYPRPEMIKVSHFLVEHGANAVIWQHTHCAGCMEWYRDAPIIYGQGNFLFDYPSSFPEWNRGVLVGIEIDEYLKISVRLIPHGQAVGRAGVYKLVGDEYQTMMHSFNSRSREIADVGVVTKRWHEFCNRNERYYLHGIRGNPGWFRRVFAKFNLLHLLDSEMIQRRRLNLIRCESHRDALITILKGHAERD